MPSRGSSIDFGTLKLIVDMMKPSPVAPVATTLQAAPGPTESTVGMAKDIQYLRESMVEVKQSLDKITDTHVTLADAQKHKEDDDKKHGEQDKDIAGLWKQMTNNTLAIARVQTWGAALLVFVGIAETLLIHFWK